MAGLVDSKSFQLISITALPQFFQNNITKEREKKENNEPEMAKEIHRNNF